VLQAITEWHAIFIGYNLLELETECAWKVQPAMSARECRRVFTFASGFAADEVIYEKEIFDQLGQMAA
jgi:hypothetical protein